MVNSIMMGTLPFLDVCSKTNTLSSEITINTLHHPIPLTLPLCIHIL